MAHTMSGRVGDKIEVEAQVGSTGTGDIAADVPGTYTVTVEITVGDADPVTQDTHLTVDGDGQIRWFTDCGEPVAG